MTVIPIRELQAPDAAEPTAPQLRLVPVQGQPHEHTWHLRSVEYDDSFEVRRYECDGCSDVMYR